MIKLDVTFSDNTLKILSNAFSGAITDPNVMQATKVAFKRGANLLRDDWKTWARGGSLEGAEDIKTPSPRLAQSIKIVENGPFDSVIGTDSPQMERVVKGQKAYDMKETYPFGRKSRRTKDGRGYLIIPFRWGTPGKNGEGRAHFRNVIPQDLYKLVKRFKASVVTDETHLESNYRGQLIERHEYFWGDRLKEEDGAIGNAEGMVKMANKGGYFTFRIISEKNMFNGDKWWKKAVEPNDVPGAIVRKNEKLIADLIEKGLLADLGQ